jgi:hypothetical protein
MKLKNKNVKIANYIAWARESHGYLKTCYNCGSTIYLHYDNDGKWKPYESWQAGNAQHGQFILHDCASAHSDAETFNSMTVNQIEELEEKIRETIQSMLEKLPEIERKLKRKKKV